jgi:hypothetical protein
MERMYTTRVPCARKIFLPRREPCLPCWCLTNITTGPPVPTPPATGGDPIPEASAFFTECGGLIDSCLGRDQKTGIVKRGSLDRSLTPLTMTSTLSFGLQRMRSGALLTLQAGHARGTTANDDLQECGMSARAHLGHDLFQRLANTALFAGKARLFLL